MVLFSSAYELFLRKERFEACFGKKTLLSLALCHPWARERKMSTGDVPQQRAKGLQRPCHQAERLAWALSAGAAAVRWRQRERLGHYQLSKVNNEYLGNDD